MVTTIPAQAVINRLQICNTKTPALATQLRASALLNQIDLGGKIVPPAAILIIRDLADPLVGHLQLGSAQMRLDPQWIRALDARVAAYYRRAVRPERGYIASEAASVLFQDEAELLACLALDLVSGRAFHHWWWQAMLRSYRGQAQMTLAWHLAQSAIQLPALLSLLAAWSLAPHVLAKLTDDETTALLSLLLRSYKLVDFRAEVRTAPQWPQVQSPVHVATARRHSEVPAPMEGTTQKMHDPPWQPWLQHVAHHSLSDERFALLGLSLTLLQRPAFAQSAPFAIAAQRWWNRARHYPAPNAQPVLDAQHPLEPYLQPSGEAVSTTDRVTPVVAHATEQSLTHHEPGHLLLHNPVDEATAISARGEAVAGPLQQRLLKDSEHRLQEGKQKEIEPKAISSEEALVPAAGALHHIPADWANGQTTALGGLLYLINAMERLHLPACFEADYHFASLVGPWGTLETLGRGILASTGTSYIEDPLWSTLAMLDGREPDTSPGANLVLPELVPIPERWQRWAAMSVESATRVTEAVLIDPLHAQLQAWLAQILPWFYGWSCHEMGLAEAAEASTLVQQLCCVRGRLFVTAGHVDLVLHLDQINLTARLHGLDQDPGWLPQWGRVIRFHFVEP